MNIEARLAELDRVDAILSEVLPLIHQRRGELAKQASPASIVPASRLLFPSLPSDRTADRTKQAFRLKRRRVWQQ